VGTGGAAASGGTGGGTGGAGQTGGAGGGTGPGGAAFPFPQNVKGSHCVLPTAYDNEKVRTAYQQWKDATITSDGAGNFQRVKKPDSGTVIGSTVSEGIGYGMLLAVYMNDQALFDNLWKYEQSHLDSNGLMNWEIGPDGKTTSGGAGAATDGDEDMAWALVMASKQWGGKGSLSETYLAAAQKLIALIWTYEVDQSRGYMLKPGDQWGNVDVTNPSYFAPAYYRVFGQVTDKASDWSKVITGNYDILEKSLNATSGNASNGLVPAWCNSSGTPVEAFSGAPKYFQNDSTRTPFRVGQDYCYFGEPRAKSYLDKITSFYVGVGVSKIVDGYDLDGTPHPDKAGSGAQPASFVGPAGVGAMSDAKYQSFLDDAYAAVATLKLTAGTIYYQKSWTALSLLMMTGSFVDFTQQ
jgi:endo-1,4-beta-D-glucanase Y